MLLPFIAAVSLLGVTQGKQFAAPNQVFVIVGARKPTPELMGKIALGLSKPKSNPMPPRLMVLDTSIPKLKVILREEDLGLLALKVKRMLFQEIGNQGQGPYGTIDTSRLDLSAIFDVGLQNGAGWDITLLRNRRSAPKLHVDIKSEILLQKGGVEARLPTGDVPNDVLDKLRKSLNPPVTKEEESVASKVAVESWGNPTEIHFDLSFDPANAEVRAEWVSIASKLYLESYRRLQAEAREAEKTALETLKASGGWPTLDQYKNANPRKLFSSMRQFESQLSSANRGLFRSSTELTDFANGCTFGGMSQSIQFQFLLETSQSPISVGCLRVTLPLPP